VSHAQHETTDTSRLALQATIHGLTRLRHRRSARARGRDASFVAAFPVNRWLIARGLGHAVVHGAHS